MFITRNIHPRFIAQINTAFNGPDSPIVIVLDWWDDAEEKKKMDAYSHMFSYVIAHLQDIKAMISEPIPISFESGRSVQPTIRKVSGAAKGVSSDFFGLSHSEYQERERLLQLQLLPSRWFTQAEFDRLAFLSNKMFDSAGSPENE